jgi:hypothetical protein
MLRKNKLNWWGLSLSVFLLLFLGVNFIFAQEGRELEIKYPIIPGVEIPATTATAFPTYVKYIFNLTIMIAGIIALGALVFGGIRYLTSGGSPSAQRDATGQITAGFFSLIVLLSSYLILFTIDPKLVVFSSPDIENIPVPTISPIPPEDIIYAYQEIPVGYFIDKTLEREKLDKIDGFSKEILQKVEELKKLAEQLENLTKKCKCEGKAIPNPSTCLPGNVCPQNIVCQGEIGSNHDPCYPYRQQIEDKKKEITKKIEEVRESTAKLEEQKEILVKDLANLTKAEELMVGCYGNPLNYENLVVMQNIFKIEIEKIEEWKDIKIPADQASFYCKK